MYFICQNNINLKYTSAFLILLLWKYTSSISDLYKVYFTLVRGKVSKCGQQKIAIHFDSWRYGQHCYMSTWIFSAEVCYINFKTEFLMLAIATFSEVQL